MGYIKAPTSRPIESAHFQPQAARAVTPFVPMHAIPPWRDRRTLAAVALLCIGQVLLWGLAAGLTYKAPEIDSAEQFVWAFSMQAGYWKHPPLPSWILYCLLRLFGPSIWLPFVATQVCIVTALALTWRLGCEFMSPRRSLIAMALTSLVTYHNIGGDSFNHNTVLLPFQAALMLLFYLATRRGAWYLWVLTGVLAGLAMLVKYVALLPLAALLLYVLLDRNLHRRRTLLGLLLAAGVAVPMLVPHLRWLVATDFLPLRYARQVSAHLPGVAATLLSLGGFVAIQLLRLLPSFGGLWFTLSRRKGDAPDAVPRLALPPGSDRLFVWVVGLAPLLITIGIGLFDETALPARWGTNDFLLTGLCAMTWLRRPDTAVMLKRCLQFTIAAQVVLCLGQTLAKTVIAEHIGRGTRANFPGALLTRQAQQTWSEHSAAPLRLLVTDIWLGGNIIAHSAQPLAVLIDGDPVKSPWVGAADVQACGALVLDGTMVDGAPPNPAIEALLAGADANGHWTLPWSAVNSATGVAAPVVIRWGIVTPREGARCELAADVSAIGMRLRQSP